MSELILDVTDGSFQEQVIKSTVPVLVDFWAEWCQPCRMILPIVEELAKKYDGKLRVVKMDIDMNPEVPMLFDVSGIPNLILFKDGTPVEQIVGFKTREQMEKTVSRHLALETA